MNISEKTSIVQANSLLESRPKMTLNETRLFLTMLARIKKEDEELKPIEIPVREIAELWGMDENAAYKDIKKALLGLQSKIFVVEKINPESGKQHFFSSTYISSAEYEQGEGFAVVEISPKFKPYLIQLKEKFTRYGIGNVIGLSSVNAIRTFELLKQYQGRDGSGWREMSIDDYKKLLGIEGKYPNNTDLKRFVLNPSKEEINENTDIYVDYELKGRGKKARIHWTIRENKTIEIDKSQMTLDDYIIDTVKENNLTANEKLERRNKYVPYYEVLGSLSDTWPKLNITTDDIDDLIETSRKMIPIELLMDPPHGSVDLLISDYIYYQAKYVLHRHRRKPIEKPIEYLLKSCKYDYDHVYKDDENE